MLPVQATLPTTLRRHLMAIVLLACGLAAAGRAAAETIWIEGEAPTSINLKPVTAGWGHKEFLSGEKWLHVNLDPAKAGQKLPDEGGLIAYAFEVKSAGNFEIWNRIGFEFVRSPFEWRLDGGAWAAVAPEELTTDLMELDFWCEVAWLKLGAQPLTAGAHKLEIHLPGGLDAKGKPRKTNYASDCLCLSSAPFHPNSKFKPGEWRYEPIDAEAAQKVFALPEPGVPGARASVALTGAWEICRDDEQLPGEVAAPLKTLPTAPIWTGITVPGDKNQLRPDLLFAHRIWYRTRVSVPASCAGQSFHLVFPLNNLNTTVFVNGAYCGFEKNPYCRFQIDVTKAVKPGVNEVWVGIRDAYYGYSTNPKDPLKLRKKFNLPIKYTSSGFQDLAYPVWNGFRSGILNTPEFVCAGAVKATDVFVKPSVAGKKLEAEITLLNTAAKAATGQIKTEALNVKTGQVEQTFPVAAFELAPGAEKTFSIAGPWADPKLWWPDAPNLYRLRTTITLAGHPVDRFEQTFGFREWGVKGSDFTLNGIVWPIWCDLVGEKATKEKWLEKYSATGQRSMRLMGATQGGIRWMGQTTDEALDFFDRNGVVVRRCGPLDGEAIGYNAIENDPDLKKLYNSKIKMDLMQNWRDQMVAQVRGERNHPSIMLWSLENEWLYINCINLHGNLMDDFEAEVKKCSEAVRATDPTRLTMTDGGGANKDQSMPVHGNHYTFGDQGYDKYPALAYDVNPSGGGRGRWTWDQQRPRFIGEDYFGNGINPADYAIFGGEAAFLGKTEARPAAALLYRILAEGYRWAGQSAWQFWLGEENMAGNPWLANAPRAVFCRQWDWTFGAGQRVTRTLGVFNNTQYPDPLTFTWTLTLGGTRCAGETKTLNVAPGTSQKFEITCAMPACQARTEGSLTLELAVGGKTVFSDAKELAVLPESRPAVAQELLVYDPQGSATAFLKQCGVKVTPLASLDGLPESGKLLLIGKDALSENESTATRLAAWALGGRRVILLEQQHPLRYQGLPAEMEPSDAAGQIAFGEDLSHLVLSGLRQQDFFTWGPDMMVYRAAYLKPTRGAKSLVQCGVRLQNSALAEVPIGSGLIMPCQMLIGEKLAESAVARRLLCNMLDYAAAYKQEFRPTAVVDAPEGRLAKVANQIGLQCTRVADPLAALASPEVKLAVIDATPANLKALADNPAKVEAFTKGGGYLVFNGLAPEGLADFSRLVGFEHIIRPFSREKVQFNAPRHPLTSGLTSGDIVMLSGERIFGWTADEYVASDEFSYVVDLEDVAPFMAFPNDFARLMVNGFRNADAWKYIVNLPLQDASWRLSLPKPQTLTEITWVPNQNYNYVTQIALGFDDKTTRTFTLQVSNDPQTFAIDPPAEASVVRLKIAAVEKNPGKETETTGLDNITIKARRPADFREKVRPLLNIGAMVEYPRGAGGIVLCNLLFKETEAVPLNAVKKRTILATLLHNLKAPFSGGKAIIAGASLKYTPIDISKQATQYRDEKGWFGNRRMSFKDLPTGAQTMAGVTYQIYEFPTSPVPTAVMLGAKGIPNNPPEEVRGIPVGMKADALFFLQTARIDRKLNDREKKQRKQFELAKYVIHYADGQTAEVPLIQGRDIDDYRQQAPAALPGAALAWTKPFEGTNQAAAAYGMQWNNPRPAVAITAIDMTYGKDRRGVPVLLAITAASSR